MTTLPLHLRIAIAIGLAASAALLVRDALTPPDVVPASVAADSAFSAERAMAHVAHIAPRPHPTGSAAIEEVRAYLLAELRALGLDPQVQAATGVGTRYPEAGRVHNVVARLPGRSGSARAVMLVSHYDSQGATPGAGDAASGTAVLLETLRALRRGQPLEHDVIALFTDGEEQGLLGAAAFARDHPWAGDVGVILNFEARGTHGRSLMFETGAGNLDVARVLHTLPEVSASSMMVFAYRVLPNDTDLSELAVLGQPAMNFAFIDGVERYHTAHDDVAHLDPRSVQHVGSHALAAARAFASGPLPRPATGDAVFFEVPMLGLIVYPEALALPLALVALALAVAVVVRAMRSGERAGRSIAAGAGVTLVGAIASGLAAALFGWTIVVLHQRLALGGAPAWRGIYWAALVALVIAVSSAAWQLARRWASTGAAAAGALASWALIAIVVTVAAPGASYLFTGPLLLAAAGMLAAAYLPPGRRWIALLVAAVLVMTVLVPVIALFGIALGLALPGAVGAALLGAFMVWLLAPLLELIVPPRLLPLGALATAVLLAAIGLLTVRPSDAYPTRANLDHVVADTMESLLPRASVVSDASVAGGRQLTLRVQAAPRTLALMMRTDADVRAASIDGIPLDTSRLRRPLRSWHWRYAAPPDSGIVLQLTVPTGAPVALELVGRQAGVPPAVLATRTAPHAVPSQLGDVTVARRIVRF